MTAKTRVAIVGGGMGGLAAAFELEATRPGEYDITVFERDWRLGGKGASGRNLAAGYGSRIEEHGLHVLMGFYENVFEILNRCYTDLRAAGTLPAVNGPWWHDVLHGLDEILFAEPPLASHPARWLFWRVHFPSNSLPIGGPAQPLPSIVELGAELTRSFWRKLAERAIGLAAAFATTLAQGVDPMARLTDFWTSPESLKNFSVGIEAVLRAVWAVLDRTDETSHKWFVALYFAGVNLIGLAEDVLWDQTNFRDRLDKLDYKEWIQQYNILKLPDIYLRESAPVNAVYDLVFSRDRGFAAGSALYDTLVMLFHYRGHIFYKMAGGMGDVIFAPLYLWLHQRNVRFKFFHDLTDIELSPDQSRVASLKFNVARSMPGGGDYEPLVPIACHNQQGQPVTLPCWPSEPLDGLAQGPGSIDVTDFDRVVLAIPVGAIAQVTNGRALCENLYVDPDFERMAKGMVTRGTRAVQLWFSTDLAGLGWPPTPQIPPPPNPALGPVLGSYKPEYKLNSWADMTQVLPREVWGPGGPRNIAYLCDVCDEPPGNAKQIVHNEAVDWLKNHAGGLWPAAAGGSPWQLLHDPSGGVGPQRFETQYWRANTDGSQRYVLGAPGTTELRLGPKIDRFSNLYVAGDWVKTPLNAGCVEGAAMGGRAAGQGIIAVQAPRLPITGSRPYITRDGDLPLLQPVILGDVELHGYIVGTSLDRLKALLASTFDRTGITCTPLLPAVLVTSVLAREIRSSVRPDDGYMRESELGFWIPVRMSWRDGTSLALYLPYLFVDNPAALLAGREIYGFNKILGQFDFRLPNEIDPTQVRAQVLHTLARDTRVEWLPVASLTGSVTKLGAIWSSAEAVIAGIAGALVVQFPGVVLGDDFSLASLPMLFLKQFRDASDGASACHQAAVLCHASLQGSFSGGLLNCAGLQFALPSHATLSIASTLGLSPTSSPRLGFWVSFTATVEVGQELVGVDHGG